MPTFMSLSSALNKVENTTKILLSGLGSVSIDYMLQSFKKWFNYHISMNLRILDRTRFVQNFGTICRHTCNDFENLRNFFKRFVYFHCICNINCNNLQQERVAVLPFWISHFITLYLQKYILSCWESLFVRRINSAMPTARQLFQYM